MTAEAASDGWAAFTRRGVTLWLPASVNLGIASLLAPAMNALLARADDPEASIAGFSVALGVITIVALPQFRIQQLTLVFLHDHQRVGQPAPLRRHHGRGRRRDQLRRGAHSAGRS